MLIKLILLKLSYNNLNIFKEMTNKKLILFMPSIEGGGVEKNFFLISSFLADKLNDITLITAEKKSFNKT